MLPVEQDANHPLGLSDRGSALERGRMVMEGPAKEFRENPHVKNAFPGI